MDWSLLTTAEIVYIVCSILILPIFILALVAQFGVSGTYNKYKSVKGSSGMTGAQVAKKLLDQAGCNVRVEQTGGGKLSDHYDPKAKVVALSNEVYNGTDVAALGVAAHEVGHAIQDHTNYPPLRLRQLIIPFGNIANRFLLPLIIISIIVDLFIGFGSGVSMYVIGGFVIIYALSVIINLVTLPTEFDASNRAVELLYETGAINSEQEKSAVKSVLNAAALTYVAALALSLVQFIRLVAWLVMMRNRN